MNHSLEASHDPLWKKIDQYFEKKLLAPDAELEKVLAANHRAELPAIDVSPLQGQYLNHLVRLKAPKRILEIGTLGGYSAICMARALSPGGKIITLELEPKHAEVAQANFELSGVSDNIEIKVGPALESLRCMADENVDPFDFVFIDANKDQNPEYFEWAVAHATNGALILIDNVVREGEVVNEQSEDPSVLGVRRLVDMIENDPQVNATALQTVGSKGFDGFLSVIVGG